MPMNRPNPDAAAILALIQAGFLAEPPADPWAVNRLRQQSSEAVRQAKAAYGAVEAVNAIMQLR